MQRANHPPYKLFKGVCLLGQGVCVMLSVMKKNLTCEEKYFLATIKKFLATGHVQNTSYCHLSIFSRVQSDSKE